MFHCSVVENSRRDQLEVSVEQESMSLLVWYLFHGSHSQATIQLWARASHLKARLRQNLLSELLVCLSATYGSLLAIGLRATWAPLQANLQHGNWIPSQRNYKREQQRMYNMGNIISEETPITFAVLLICE